MMVPGDLARLDCGQVELRDKHYDPTGSDEEWTNVTILANDLLIVISVHVNPTVTLESIFHRDVMVLCEKGTGWIFDYHLRKL